jgi:hypothetical protein
MNSFTSVEQSDIRTERIFNLFLFVENGVIATYGAKYHKMSGPENYKLAHLQSLVDDDVLQSRRFPIPKSFVLLDSATGTRLDGAISVESFYEFVASGRHPTIFEEVFAVMSAPRDPLCCITYVVDGVVTVDSVVVLNDPNPDSAPSNPASKEGGEGRESGASSNTLPHSPEEPV